jgi:hypothetical protein
VGEHDEEDKEGFIVWMTLVLSGPMELTVGTERESCLPLIWVSAGLLVHKDYQKLTLSNLYLSSNSHCHSSNKHAVLSMLVHRAISLCGPAYIVNWSFSGPLLGGMATATDRSDRLSTHWIELHSPWRKLPQLPS